MSATTTSTPAQTDATIWGMANVVEMGEAAGSVRVLRGDGDTIVDLTVTDRNGTTAVVHLDAWSVDRLMAALGHASYEI